MPRFLPTTCSPLRRRSREEGRIDSNDVVGGLRPPVERHERESVLPSRLGDERVIRSPTDDSVRDEALEERAQRRWLQRDGIVAKRRQQCAEYELGRKSARPWQPCQHGVRLGEDVSDDRRALSEHPTGGDVVRMP